MLRFLIILLIVLGPLYIGVSSVAPEIANYFGLFIFSLVGLYLLYRIPLEIILYYKKEDIDEENDEDFDQDDVKTYYDLEEYQKALKKK